MRGIRLGKQKLNDVEETTEISVMVFFTNRNEGYWYATSDAYSILNIEILKSIISIKDRYSVS